MMAKRAVRHGVGRTQPTHEEQNDNQNRPGTNDRSQKPTRGNLRPQLQHNPLWNRNRLGERLTRNG